MSAVELEIRVSPERLSKEPIRYLALAARSDLRGIRKKVKNEKENQLEQPLDKAIANLEFIEFLRSLDSVKTFLRRTQRPVEIYTTQYPLFERIGMYVFAGGVYDAYVKQLPFVDARVLRVWSERYSPKFLKFIWERGEDFSTERDRLLELANMSRLDIVKKFEKAIK